MATTTTLPRVVVVVGAVGGRFPEATGLGGPYISPVVPKERWTVASQRRPGWAGPILAPWSRVERCCVLARYFLGAWVLSQFVLQKQRAAAASAGSGGGERCVRGCACASAAHEARHDR